MKGVCQVCGCTDNFPCVDSAAGMTCCWVTEEQDLCDFCLKPLGDPEADEPLIVPATEYQAQRFIEDLRRMRGAL